MVKMTKLPRAVNKLAAYTPESHDGIRKVGEYRTLIAAQILREGSHGAAPHAFISGEQGDVDWYIILNDSRGTRSALTIEFGRRGGNLDKNGRVVTPSRAVAPLRRAVNLQ